MLIALTCISTVNCFDLRFQVPIYLFYSQQFVKKDGNAITVTAISYSAVK